jgi:primosomal protein N' (replication factor Y)
MPGMKTFRTSYIEVAVALPVSGTFTYSVPDDLHDAVAPGMRVLVPFGRRRVTGYVLGPGTQPDELKIKPILSVLDETAIYPASMLPLFQWLSDYYKHPLGEVIRQALPAGLSPSDCAALARTSQTESVLSDEALPDLERGILQLVAAQSPVPLRRLQQSLQQSISARLLDTLERRGWVARVRMLAATGPRPQLTRYVRWEKPLPGGARRTQVRSKIIDLLKAEGEVPLRHLKSIAPSAPKVVSALADLGVVSVSEKREYRNPFGEPIQPDTALELTPDQQSVVSRVCARRGDGFHVFLLNGVTGSGKTEVYLHVASEVIQRGLGVLVLVPEIALITQIEHRFRARFGERVAILHSGLSAGQRLDQWSQIMEREAVVAIGARSAVFAPFDRLGAIIVDEEHDPSYKQESSPRYNARDLAIVRARQNNCVALLGSATPSVQSLYNVERGKFEELSLPRRIHHQPLPRITVVDLRDSKGFRGSLRFITPQLQQAMAETLERNEQALLFLNRRGFATFPVCSSCGSALRCRHCDITMTLHQRDNAYRCHYCGHSRSAVSRCDSCGKDAIKPLGMGTEKIEAAVREMFPSARVARMDRDTTRRRGAIVKLLKSLRQRTTDILVGTQMVAKGHDYPAITLVGVICADLSLNFPDFRAGERTFQLLAQVAGRAGRGRRPGRVILQTYNPDHFSIAAAQQQDVKSFYQSEIAFRRALEYPPFSRLILLKISGKQKAHAGAWAELLGQRLHQLIGQSSPEFDTVRVLGPIESSLAKVAGRFRWQILLKCTSTAALHRFVGLLMSEHPKLFNHRGVRVAVDVDPFFMM